MHYKKFIKPMLSFLIFCSLSVTVCNASVRYVSHTGSSTLPYTSWATAADSIQKVINICNNGDTVIVANGVYKETLVIDSALTLLGSSMDSCIIDGTGLNGIGGGLNDEGKTIKASNYLNIQNFHIKGKGIEPLTDAITAFNDYFVGKNLRIENAAEGIGTLGGATLENSFFINVIYCITTSSSFNQDTFKVSNNIFISNQANGAGILNAGGGIHYINNNIIIGLYPSLFTGIDLSLDNYSEVKNNLVANYQTNNYDGGQYINGAVVENNVFLQNNNEYQNNDNIVISGTDKSIIKNNVIAYAKRFGIQTGAGAVIDYNLFWKNTSAVNSTATPGENNILADPMFVKDTIPTEAMDYDFHLQKYSPAIDAGDPEILDKDGTRSDIGMYGGDLGNVYSYMDLPPRIPQDISYSINTDSQEIKLSWRKNTEADFKNYIVYKDTLSKFTIDTTNKLLETDTSYFNDYYSNYPAKFYYKITAVDSQGNESNPSQDIEVIITDIKEPKVKIVNDYFLYQNFPNPFNPQTTIGFRIKERSYVKLMVYDILGKLIKTLVNNIEEQGYHEVKFNAENLSSGIYLYRIEIVGENNIPKYLDMKKLIHLK